MNTISEDTFYELYQPIKNHIDDNAPFDGSMFETFGSEEAFVRMQPPNTIWTLIETDGQLWIVSGFHCVNRLGYFISKIPIENGVDVEFPLED